MIDVGYTFTMPYGAPATVIARGSRPNTWLVLVNDKNSSQSHQFHTDTILSIIANRKSNESP